MKLIFSLQLQRKTTRKEVDEVYTSQAFKQDFRMIFFLHASEYNYLEPHVMLFEKVTIQIDKLAEYMGTFLRGFDANWHKFLYTKYQVHS